TVPPGAPKLTSPNNNAVTTNARQALKWQAVSGTSRYQVQIDDNSDYSSPFYNLDTITGTSFTPPASLPQRTYYWRVRAIDAAGNISPWSEDRSFSVNIMKSPSNNAVIVTRTPARPTFQWT